VGYAHIENFALKIFLNADNEDRAGKASKWVKEKKKYSGTN
jgi:vacuolar protein sorting-associated protein VTA1